MQFICADSHLGPEPVSKTVAEPRTAIVEHVARIHKAHKLFRRVVIRSNNRIGMPGSITVDMVDCLIQTIDDGQGSEIGGQVQAVRRSQLDVNALPIYAQPIQVGAGRCDPLGVGVGRNDVEI